MTNATQTYWHLGIDGRPVEFNARPHSPLQFLAEFYGRPMRETSGDGHGRPEDAP